MPLYSQANECGKNDCDSLWTRRKVEWKYLPRLFCLAMDMPETKYLAEKHKLLESDRLEKPRKIILVCFEKTARANMIWGD